MLQWIDQVKEEKEGTTKKTLTQNDFNDDLLHQKEVKTITVHKTFHDFQKALRKNALSLEQITGVAGLNNLDKFVKDNVDTEDTLR